MKNANLKLEEPGQTFNETLSEQFTSTDEYGRREFLSKMGKGLAVVTSVSLLGTAREVLSKPVVVKKTATGAADLYAFKCGVLKTQTQYMLKDTRIGTPMDIPVTFF